jgi:glycosyltransferase involved in cell wall biosynthesis
MRRIAYVTHANEVSGAEFSLLRLVTSPRLRESGFDPVVVVAAEGPLVADLERSGVEVHVLAMGARSRGLSKDRVGSGLRATAAAAAGSGAYAARLGALLRRERIDLVHSNSLKAHLYSVPVVKALRVPLVWHVRDTINTSYLPAPAVRLVRGLARVGPDHVIGVSRPVLDELHLRLRVPATVVHDGLTTAELDRLAHPAVGRRAVDEDGALAVAMVGRLDRWKGQHVAIEAVRRAAQSGHEIRLLIAGAALFGKQAYEQELRGLIADHGLAGLVELLGNVADVPALLGRVDALVHASISPDPLPGVVLEGMAAGLPVVASRGGGVPEMIRDDETGRLVDMGDSAALADELVRLAKDPAERLRLGGAAQSFVRREFTLDKTVEGVVDVYRSLLR